MAILSSLALRPNQCQQHQYDDQDKHHVKVRHLLFSSIRVFQSVPALGGLRRSKPFAYGQKINRPPSYFSAAGAISFY